MQQLQFDSKPEEPKFNTVWLPLLVGILLFTVIGLFAIALNQEQQREQLQTVERENKKIASYLESDLTGRIAAIERLIGQWSVHGGFTETEFVKDVQSLVNDMPGFQAIEWVDPDYTVRWVVPLANNKEAVGLNLAFEEKRRLALESAKNNGNPTMTAPIDLVQGGKGFLIYFPINSLGKFEGFILAVFRVEDWLKYVLESQEFQSGSGDLITAVSLDDVSPIYAQAGWADQPAGSKKALVLIKILGHRFTIQSRPSLHAVTNNLTYLPELVAIFGLILALLIGSLVRLFQNATSDAWRAYVNRNALETEIENHQRTAGELQYTLSRLDMATEAGGIGVWSWHVSTNILTWNERMYQLYGLPSDLMPMYETWRKSIHPDDMVFVETLLNNAVNGKAIFNTEFRIIPPSGDVRYLGAAARVERDFTGKAVRVNGINWDLTELKQAEATLKKSEGQVRLLLNSTAEAIYGIDMNGNCTFANPSCLRMLGYARAEDLLGKNMHWLIHHSRVDGSRLDIGDCKIFQALADGRDIHEDSEVLWRSDHTSFPVEYWSYPQIVNNEVTGTVVTFVDITARKRADRLLAEERYRLSSILEGTNAGTWEWNIQTGDLVINERWAEMVGYTLEELQPVSFETWKKFSHPDDLRSSIEIIQKHFDGELHYYESEVRLRHKEGFWVWVLDRGKITSRTSDGKPLLMSGTHQDITHRMMMENTLIKSEAQNRALLSAIPDLIFRIQQDGIIVDYKAISSDLLVIPAERIIGYSFYDVLDDFSAAEARASITRAIESGQVQSMEFSLHLGESTHFYEARFKNSGVDEVIAIIRDISERTRLEQMKSDFINRATHEMRTPITTMLLMVNLIDGDPNNPDFKEYWNVLISELNRERMLVEDLLSAGRLEGDQFQFSFRPLEVSALITKTVQQWEPAAREKNISMIMESLLQDSEALMLVRADENALRQVFTNLVGNAIKFTNAGGSVRVRVQKVGKGIQISIIDTGIGIPSEDLPMLFNRFFRGSNAVLEEIQGTGIGLFIVRSILDKHAGHIEVATELGKGSQFDVWLPEMKEGNI